MAENMDLHLCILSIIFPSVTLDKMILLADDKLSGADQTCRFVVYVCLFDVDW